MKTIDEAAKEYCEPIAPEKDYETGARVSIKEIADEIIDGFKAGVAFAQRWYSVQEESPPNDDFVLVKDTTGLFEVGTYDLSEKSFYINDMSCMCVLDITHWRPIEIK